MDKRFVLLADGDNVFVCCGQVQAGETVVLEGSTAVMSADINVGHKVARRAMTKGTKILKYGAPIGSAVCDIDFAEHVHLHNMKSDYISSHTRASKVEVSE